MTQPPQGPYGPGDKGDPQWGQGPGDGSQQPGWGGGQNEPTWGGQASEPTWGGQSASEPTWGGQPGSGSTWGNQQPPYNPSADYPQGQTGQYPAGYQPYGATPPPPGPAGPGGYGPPPGPNRSNKTPWIIGIAVAAVLVVVLAVVLFVTLGGDDSTDPVASDTSSTTSSPPSTAAEAEEEVETAIRTYTTAFTDRDWDEAVAVTCGAEQATVRDIQTKDSDTAGMKLNSVTGIEVSGDTAEATVSLTFIDPTDQAALETNRYTFELENRLGDWKVCSSRKI